MAIEDLWRLRDGTPSKRDGRGLRWRVRVQGYRSTAHRTKTEAERVNAQRVTAGPPRPSSSVTVGDLLDRWLAGKQGLSPRGVEACRGDANHIRSRWGAMLAADVSNQDVQEWIAGLTVERGPKGERVTKPASEALRRRLLQCLRGALAVGGLHPLDGVRVPKDHRREPVFLTVGELGRLAVAIGPRWSTMVWLLGTTGLRVGEACALNVGDVDVKRGRARVAKAKGRRGRDVPIIPEVMAMLDLDREASAPLIVGPKGARINQDVWRARFFRPATVKAGFQGMRIHDLRHTAVSLAVASGALLTDVQAMAGHSRLSTTADIYSHWYDRMDEVSSRMSALVGTVPRLY